MNRYTTTIEIDRCDIHGIHTVVLDKVTVAHSHSTHTEGPTYRVSIVSSIRDSDKRVLLETPHIGHATDKYMKIINNYSIMEAHVDAWFTKNKPSIDKGMDSLFNRMIDHHSKIDNYGTDMED